MVAQPRCHSMVKLWRARNLLSAGRCRVLDEQREDCAREGMIARYESWRPENNSDVEHLSPDLLSRGHLFIAHKHRSLLTAFKA